MTDKQDAAFEALYCDHIYCSNGCTIRSGLCEECAKLRVDAAFAAGRASREAEVLAIIEEESHEDGGDPDYNLGYRESCSDN